ncbi:Uncharacterized protein Fot_51824 [Forsythia ovata]|uniref:Uncharacterized protein n=1 Tax=Forsythia ovata TaxID=205694 RepID=A0ABD1PXE2_9LAMI
MEDLLKKRRMTESDQVMGGRFMPTPGVDTRHADFNVLSGPEVSRPVAEGLSKVNTEAEAAVIITEEVDISSIGDELEQFESHEATTNRAERTKARRQRNMNALQSSKGNQHVHPDREGTHR